MIYTLKDLLTKMGAPDAAERGGIEWFYFDSNMKDLAGFAGLRFEAGGERLTAEIKHNRKDFEDDDGIFHDRHTDYFLMTAERTARPGHYRVTSIAFDGSRYEKPTAAIIELGLGVFHARALDISLAMAEQNFPKENTPQKRGETTKLFRDFMGHDSEITAAKNAPRLFAHRQFKISKTLKNNAVSTEKAAAAGAVILPFRNRQALGRAS